MATSTFNKRIVLGRAASKRLAKELKKSENTQQETYTNTIPLMNEKDFEQWKKQILSK